MLYDKIASKFIIVNNLLLKQTKTFCVFRKMSICVLKLSKITLIIEFILCVYKQNYEKISYESFSSSQTLKINFYL